jgi:hypothetical protein
MLASSTGKIFLKLIGTQDTRRGDFAVGMSCTLRASNAPCFIRSGKSNVDYLAPLAWRDWRMASRRMPRLHHFLRRECRYVRGPRRSFAHCADFNLSEVQSR